MTSARTIPAAAAVAAALAIPLATAAGIAGMPPALAAAPAPDGGALFKQRCQGCHSGSAAPIAPNLSGVVGRKAAATDYHYSPALKASGLTWNTATLDRFLSGPMQLVPGTRMVVRVSDPAERAAIIAYLSHTR